MEKSDPNEWRSLADDYRRSAAHWRKLIEREEGPHGDGYARSPRWPEIKALLLEMAEGYERDAREIEAQIALSSPFL